MKAEPAPRQVPVGFRDGPLANGRHGAPHCRRWKKNSRVLF